MTCGDKFNQNCPTGGTRVEPAEVAGRPQCRNPLCRAVLRGDGTCPQGCPQGAPDETAPVAEAAPVAGKAGGRCPRCRGVLVDGQCVNPVCASRWREPQAGEAPGPENGWRWVRPAGNVLPGDDLRAKRGIPPAALVQVEDWGDGHRYGLVWFDPARSGVLDAVQRAWVFEPYLRRKIDTWAKDPGRSGFVVIDAAEWDRAHPSTINSLLDMPGVARSAVEQAEVALLAQSRPDRSPQREVLFIKDEHWRKLDQLNEGPRPERLARFERVFPPAQWDVPMDITIRDGDWSCTDERTTPRAFAAFRLYMWGLGGQGHHPQAQQLAEQCGLELTAGELCPMQPPLPGDGNPEYLLDYTVDGERLVGFALDLNRHVLYGLPEDTRDHHNGWDSIDRVAGHEEVRHGAQNWVTVGVRRGEGARTARHSAVGVYFGQGNMPAAEARAQAVVVAAALVRLGHDPQAELLYEEGAGQVTTTVGALAREHRSRVATTGPAAARPAAEAGAGKASNAQWRITQAGARLWQEIAEPARAWGDQRPARGSVAATQAAQELGRAALCLREALLAIDVADGRLLHDLAEFSVAAAAQAQRDPVAMIGQFSRLKALTHVHLRRSPRAAQEYGEDFARVFGG